jgi:hypothetical protein
VSKRTDAKKARRRKRQAARELRRPAGDIGDLLSVEGIDEVLTDRGWEFDVDSSSEEFASWVYAPSAFDTDDEAVETVTRIWLTLEDQEDDVDDEDLEWHVLFVGATVPATDYVFSPESLLQNLAAIEEYRQGDPPPAFEE